jgi:hypothetical protein
MEFREGEGYFWLQVLRKISGGMLCLEQLTVLNIFSWLGSLFQHLSPFLRWRNWGRKWDQVTVQKPHSSLVIELWFRKRSLSPVSSFCPKSWVSREMRTAGHFKGIEDTLAWPGGSVLHPWCTAGASGGLWSSSDQMTTEGTKSGKTAWVW